MRDKNMIKKYAIILRLVHDGDLMKSYPEHDTGESGSHVLCKLRT